jgi:hypothetical protein
VLAVLLKVANGGEDGLPHHNWAEYIEAFDNYQVEAKRKRAEKAAEKKQGTGAKKAKKE